MPKLKSFFVWMSSLSEWRDGLNRTLQTDILPNFLKVEFRNEFSIRFLQGDFTNFWQVEFRADFSMRFLQGHGGGGLDNNPSTGIASGNHLQVN